MKITKEQEARILELDPNFFNLELGKWYKGNYGVDDILFFFESLNDEGNIKGYGFNRKGWYDNRWTESHYSKLSDVADWILATPKEVEDRLEKEARIRYSTGDLVRDLSRAKDEINLNMESAVMHYYPSSNRFFLANIGKGGKVLFEKGEWAEIIPIKKPSEKDLRKEAEERGFVQGACVDNTNIGFTLEGRKISGSDNYYLDGSEILCIGGCYVYSKGQWAEIIETDKYYKNSVYLFKVGQNGYYIQICDSDDCFGIQRYKTPLTTSVLVVEATEQEFNTAYKSTSQRLKNLKND